MPVFGGPVQKRGTFRTPHFKLPTFGGRFKWPSFRGIALPWGFIFRVLIVLLPVLFLLWEYGKARTYMPFGSFWQRLGFMWTDTTNMVGNSFEGVYRFATKGDSVAAPFAENDWPRHVLICTPVEVNGIQTEAQELKRKLHIADYERSLHWQVMNRSGELWGRLMEETHKRRHLVVFLPLPGTNSFEILSHPKATMQTCKGGRNPAVESHKIAVSVLKGA